MTHPPLTGHVPLSCSTSTASAHSPDTAPLFHLPNSADTQVDELVIKRVTRLVAPDCNLTRQIQLNGKSSSYAIAAYTCIQQEADSLQAKRETRIYHNAVDVTDRTPPEISVTMFTSAGSPRPNQSEGILYASLYTTDWSVPIL